MKQKTDHNKCKRNFRLVLIGLIISLFGSAIQRFSFSLYLLDLTHDAAIFSNVMAISVLPFILFAPLSGTIADQFNKKWIMVCLDVLSALSIGGYLLVHQNLDAKIWPTALVMFLLSAISAFYTPAVTAMIPLIVDEKGLMKANALVSQIGSTANLAGPVLAGLFYGIFGIKGVTLINGISFLGSAVLELFILFSQEQRAEKKRISITSSNREMKESFLYLKKEKRVVLQFINSYCMFNLCLVPVMTILLPYVIRTQLEVSAAAYGIVEGVIAGGMIAGAFFVAAIPRLFHVNRIYRWDFAIAGAIFAMLLSGLIPQKTIIIVAWTLCGFLIMAALGIGNVVTLSHTQKIIDVGHLGKVSAYSTAVATVSVPIGQMLFGWYLHYIGNITIMLLLVGTLNLLVIWYLKRAVHNLPVES